MMATGLIPLMRAYVLFAASGLLCVSADVCAASFDCRKAATQVEKLICSDPASSLMDEELAALFARARASGAAKNVSDSQRAWLRERNRCRNADCVYAAYKARLRVLTDALQAAPSRQAVMQRLAEQLDMLKSTSKTTALQGESACRAYWEQLGAAIVPEPTVFAITTDEKKALYARLATIAERYKAPIASTMTQAQAARFEQQFDAAWRDRRILGDVSDVRVDDAHLLFIQGHGENERALAAVVLLDRKQGGLTLRAAPLYRGEALFTPHGTLLAVSKEWFGENDPERPFGGLSEAAGLLSLRDEILAWRLVATHSPLSRYRYYVVIAPLWDAQTSGGRQCTLTLQ